MIDIQNHLRNEGLLNLFDGRSVAPHKDAKFENRWIVVSPPRQCGKSWFRENYQTDWGDMSRTMIVGDWDARED